MPRLSSLDQIDQLYADRGRLKYGEGVTQLEHALQCAALAQADGYPPSLVVAALLHDIGHLFEREDTGAGVLFNDLHEASGAEALAGLFGEAVCAPVALHVDAKRYLCCVEPGYHDALSPASKASLALQGGPFDAAEAAAFEAKSHWREAVALRRYDDLGKRDEAAAVSWADYQLLMRELAL